MAIATAWRDQARCSGAPIEELLLVTIETNEAGDLWPHELWDLNRSRLGAAIDTYCSGCPVTQECWDDAEREGVEDALWTVRGGRFPVLLDPERPDEPTAAQSGHGRPFRTYSVDADGVWRCPKGHERETVGIADRTDGRKQCTACDVVRGRKSWETTLAKRADYTLAV